VYFEYAGSSGPSNTLAAVAAAPRDDSLKTVLAALTAVAGRVADSSLQCAKCAVGTGQGRVAASASAVLGRGAMACCTASPVLCTSTCTSRACALAPLLELSERRLLSRDPLLCAITIAKGAIAPPGIAPATFPLWSLPK